MVEFRVNVGRDSILQLSDKISQTRSLSGDPIPPKFLAFGVTINFLTVSLSSETITKFYINQTIHYWIICVGITLWKEGKARKNIVSPHLLERLSLLGKADLVKAQR